MIGKCWKVMGIQCSEPCCFDRKLVEDAEAGIFTVTLFKCVISEFKAKAKHHK